MKKVIYTCGNDRMTAYLEQLLKSIRNYNSEIEIKIIPFDDNLKKTKELAQNYNAKIINTNPIWDEIGKNLYGDIEYRPGIMAWRYFRKFNSFNAQDETIFFMDANTLCLSNFNDLNIPEDCDFIFHNHSAMGRCFRIPEFEKIISQLSPGIKGGFNMGFFISKSSSIDINFAKYLSVQRNLSLFFGKAPEQAFLAYYITILNKKFNLLHEVAKDSAFNHTSNQGIDSLDDYNYFVTDGPSKGRKLYVVKSTGQDIEKNSKHQEIIKKISEKADR